MKTAFYFLKTFIEIIITIYVFLNLIIILVWVIKPEIVTISDSVWLSIDIILTICLMWIREIIKKIISVFKTN